jgi:hypothetical protein
LVYRVLIGGSTLTSELNHQKTFFNDALELASTVARIHELYNNPEHWPGSESHPSAPEAAAKYRDKMETIHNVYRSSCALIAQERGLEPLRDAIARITPEVETMVKERNTQLIDYDSYRRRVKALKEKHQQYEENGKSTTTAAQENLAEITRFENKEKNAKELFEEKNYKTKQEFLKAKDQHDRIMDDLLIANVVCQVELFTRAAKELEDVLSLLPPERVRENTFWFILSLKPALLIRCLFFFCLALHCSLFCFFFLILGK